MTFLYPLGLLGLIGIPILILIYIIKTKYTEQTVASTFLWTLSERFLKRKNPISKLTGIISLVLQLLLITTISLAIAHPVITLPNSAKEYCFILDCSAGMNMGSDGKTRLDSAKDEIERVIDKTTDGSRYTLITVGNGTTKVYERLDNKSQAKALLRDVEQGYREDSYTDAIGMAQSYFDENNGLITYLVTDRRVGVKNNVSVINVTEGEKNFSISDVTYSIVEGKLTVTGNIKSFDGSPAIKLSMYLDGAESPVYTGTFATSADLKTPFNTFADAESFRSIRLTIDTPDDYALDNEFIIYNKESESSYSTLIVSERPFFIKTAFESILESKITVISPEEFGNQRGYGLYIFDSFSPAELPSDGATWFINPRGSVDKSGFSYQGDVELESAGLLELSKSSSTAIKKLREELRGTDLYLKRYVKCGLYRDFSVLYSYQSNPIIFTGTNSYGNREAVFAFDLHDSILPLEMHDYIVIMRNLIEYSFPDIIEKTEYFAGETLTVNVMANCESIRIDSPSGRVTYLDTSRASSDYTLTEVGTYTVTATISGSPRVFNVYSSVIEEEREPVPYLAEISLAGEAGDGGFDGSFDTLTVLFIIIALLFIMDWGVYCYEKHQL